MNKTFGRKAISVDAGGALNCPDCGDNYLHHRDTTIFERGEDGDTTTVIAQNGRSAQVSDFPSDDTCNPSWRRNGLIIEFECEHCHGPSWDPATDEHIPSNAPPLRLAIIQHKGNTFMEWL